MMQCNRKTLEILARISREAGALIMQARAEGLTINHKQDDSPVTHADERANEWIVAALAQEFPEIPIISEECPDSRFPIPDSQFWLVDPLDGTKGFIRGEDEFTVNIGLIEQRHPIGGVIYLPARNVLYAGSREVPAYRIDANGAEAPIRVNAPQGNQRSVLVSKHHASPEEQQLLASYEITQRVQASSSLKFCLVADGTADLYPRSGPTMEWDTAAGHAILLAAGGRMTTLDGGEFLYGKEGFKNPGFVAGGCSPL